MKTKERKNACPYIASLPTRRPSYSPRKFSAHFENLA